MRAIFILLLVIAAAAGPASAEMRAAQTGTTQTGTTNTAGKAIALRNDVIVKGGLVRLGDIFRNTGAKATIAIAYAPAPGRQAVLDASWLSETADRHGLDWRPQSYLDQVVIRRASIPLSREVVAGRISRMVRARGQKGDFRIELSYRIQNIHLPVGSGGRFAIRDLRIDERSGRFSGLLTASGANPPVRLNIYGRVQKLVAVPVLIRRLRKGAVIRDADIEVRKIVRSALTQYTLLERSEIVGMAARYQLRSGVAIRKGDVRPPILVRRGELVTMEIRTPHILITVRARALESGARGETIRLRNTQSKKTIEARILGPGRVSVSIAGQQAAR